MKHLGSWKCFINNILDISIMNCLQCLRLQKHYEVVVVF